VAGLSSRTCAKATGETVQARLVLLPQQGIAEGEIEPAATGTRVDWDPGDEGYDVPEASGIEIGILDGNPPWDDPCPLGLDEY
jgi:hypothetical protein